MTNDFKSDEQTIFAVCWNYYDGSNFGILKTFRSGIAAKRYMEEVKKISDRQIEIVETYLDEQP